MKTLNTYIQEKLVIKRDKGPKHTLFPESKEELRNMIMDEIKNNHYNYEISLNHIDTSKITDMSCLFEFDGISSSMNHFNGDISKWDVSNVTDMHKMFRNSDFTGKNSDLSNWDVSNVTDMSNMFEKCYLHGELGISTWDVSNVTRMSYMFKHAFIEDDLSEWDVSNVKYIDGIFWGTAFFNSDITNWKLTSTISLDNMFYKNNHYKQDLSKLDVSHIKSMQAMFAESSYNGDISGWNVNKCFNTGSTFGCIINGNGSYDRAMAAVRAHEKKYGEKIKLKPLNDDELNNK